MPGSARVRLGVVALLAACVGLVDSPASAHDELVGATPADGAVVDTAPGEIVLEFFEPIGPDGTSMVLRDDEGDVVDDLDVVVDDRTMSAALPGGLDDGTWAVEWAIASDDTHAVDGVTRFAIDAPSTSMEYVGEPDAGASWPVVAGAVAAGVGVVVVSAVVLRRRSRSVG